MDIREAAIENEQLEKAARKIEYFLMIDRGMAHWKLGKDRNMNS